MATLREIVYEIIKTVRGGGHVGRDERINERLLAFKVGRLRGDYIYDNKKYAVRNPQLVQDLGCLTLSECDVSECPNVPYGFTVKKVIIPKMVAFPYPLEGEGFAYVGTIKKTFPFNFARAEDIEDRLKSRFAPNMNFYYPINTGLYVVLGKDYEDTAIINVRGILSDPTKGCFTGSDGVTQCFDWDTTPYPIDDDTLSYCFKNIMELDMGFMLQTTDDTKNDGASV